MEDQLGSMTVVVYGMLLLFGLWLLGKVTKWWRSGGRRLGEGGGGQPARRLAFSERCRERARAISRSPPRILRGFFNPPLPHPDQEMESVGVGGGAAAVAGARSQSLPPSSTRRNSAANLGGNRERMPSVVEENWEEDLEDTREVTLGGEGGSGDATAPLNMQPFLVNGNMRGSGGSGGTEVEGGRSRGGGYGGRAQSVPVDVGASGAGNGAGGGGAGASIAAAGGQSRRFLGLREVPALAEVNFYEEGFVHLAVDNGSVPISVRFKHFFRRIFGGRRGRGNVNVDCVQESSFETASEGQTP